MAQLDVLLVVNGGHVSANINDVNLSPLDGVCKESVQAYFSETLPKCYVRELSEAKSDASSAFLANAATKAVEKWCSTDCKASAEKTINAIKKDCTPTNYFELRNADVNIFNDFIPNTNWFINDSPACNIKSSTNEKLCFLVVVEDLLGAPKTPSVADMRKVLCSE